MAFAIFAIVFYKYADDTAQGIWKISTGSCTLVNTNGKPSLFRVGLMMCAVSAFANLTNLVHYATLYVFLHHHRRYRCHWLCLCRRRRRRHHWRFYFKIYTNVIWLCWAHNTHMVQILNWILLQNNAPIHISKDCAEATKGIFDRFVLILLASHIRRHRSHTDILLLHIFVCLRDATYVRSLHVREPLTLSFYLLLFGIIWRKSINSVQLKSSHK